MSIKLTTSRAPGALVSSPIANRVAPIESSRASVPAVRPPYKSVFPLENFAMDDVALHFISLAFIRISINKVMLEVEAAFSEHYAAIMKKVHIRGMLSIIVFLIGTIVYDYAILVMGIGTSLTSNQTIFKSAYSMTAFYVTLALRFGIIIPLLGLNVWAATHASHDRYMRITWVSHVFLGSYPIVYNKLTSDYGVSWFCLFIMYFYNCTPIPFFHMLLFNATLQLTYAAVVLTGASSTPDEQEEKAAILREWLYAILFYVLVSFPSQSREFAIRVSYMSETMLLFQQNKLEQEELRSKSLLGSMLPASVVSQLQAGRELIADEYASVTVLFCEVCDFNTISGQLDPDQVVELLNTIFSKFDVLVDYHSVHKIETIGAVYMVSGGCPDRMTNHAILIANLALDMIAAMPDLRAHIRKTFKWAKNIGDINIRIGINTGILMAGVVGIRNPRFKLFGDTVNVSSRMESTNLPGHIQLTEATHDAIKHAYVTEHRGTIPVKGRGDMQTFFLRGHQIGVPHRALPLYIEAPIVTTTPDKPIDKPAFVTQRTEGDARSSFMKLIPMASEAPGKLLSGSFGRSSISVKPSYARLAGGTMTKTSSPPRELTRTIDEEIAWAASQTSQMMELPLGMTKKSVFFYINGDNAFELMYRKENEKRWMRFFRSTVLLLAFVKPLLTMYQVLTNGPVQFTQSQQLFTLNLCITFPLCVVFLLFTFSREFYKWRQLSSVAMVLAIGMIFNIESSVVLQASGHSYITIAVLYQCHCSIVSFLLRFLSGFVILLMYITTNIVPTDLSWANTNLYLRNAMYVCLFFVPQAWIVFTSEYKQRVNHFRDLVLNAQQGKLLEEQDRVAKLLRNLLPESIVNQLKASPEVTIAETFENVTILFTDMVNFTAYSSRVSAMELVQFLNDMYTRFDTISEKRDLYKVEIIGDAYFVVGGCPLVTTNDAVMILKAGLDMLNTLPVLRRNSSNPNLNIRIGVHSGRVVAGVVGIKDPRYHLFGETVAIAQSLESSGVPGRIHLSETTYTRIKNTDPNAFKFEYHKMLNVPGHNTKLRTYFVT